MRRTGRTARGDLVASASSPGGVSSSIGASIARRRGVGQGEVQELLELAKPTPPPAISAKGSTTATGVKAGKKGCSKKKNALENVAVNTAAVAGAVKQQQAKAEEEDTATGENPAVREGTVAVAAAAAASSPPLSTRLSLRDIHRNNLAHAACTGTPSSTPARGGTATPASSERRRQTSISHSANNYLTSATPPQGSMHQTAAIMRSLFNPSALSGQQHQQRQQQQTSASAAGFVDPGLANFLARTNGGASSNATAAAASSATSASISNNKQAQQFQQPLPPPTAMDELDALTKSMRASKKIGLSSAAESDEKQDLAAPKTVNVFRVSTPVRKRIEAQFSDSFFQALKRVYQFALHHQSQRFAKRIQQQWVVQQDANGSVSARFSLVSNNKRKRTTVAAALKKNGGPTKGTKKTAPPPRASKKKAKQLEPGKQNTAKSTTRNSKQHPEEYIDCDEETSGSGEENAVDDAVEVSSSSDVEFCGAIAAAGALVPHPSLQTLHQVQHLLDAVAEDDASEQRLAINSGVTVAHTQKLAYRPGVSTLKAVMLCFE